MNGCLGLLGLAEHVHAPFQSPAPAQRPFAQPAVLRRARTCASPGNLEAVFVGARARSSSTPADGAVRQASSSDTPLTQALLCTHVEMAGIVETLLTGM